MKTSFIYSEQEIIEATTVPNWGKVAFESFKSDLLSESAPFPCVLGVEGFKHNLLRFGFCASPYDESDMKQCALALRQYLREFRSLGRYTSFVMFFKPEKTKTMQQYEKMFWDTLETLHSLDEELWPDDIPLHPNDPLWEFCFGGEPIFVVCNTPAHQSRKSRRSHTFMITFQPRWVFEGISEDTKIGNSVKRIVRNRLKMYDEVHPHPELGWYGNAQNREWKQYFLHDTNDEVTTKCPFLSKERNSYENKKSLY
ncbi:YqcI/YcgG family protein [Metabacillus iocasae]|uniref:FPC/CPF motif-containing protein YcgG n=1 Tax=Priestia iocasae TaxID=2291674 RepID=A0ABS2QXU1_9BACI|nr:FPC/CPF motif-containing protein YcgG [Metabacillus iocasae]